MVKDYNEVFWANASDSEIERAAIAFFGQKPSSRTKEELRFGTRGSKCVSLARSHRGQWYDHEGNEGGYLDAPGHEASRPKHDWFDGYKPEHIDDFDFRGAYAKASGHPEDGPAEPQQKDTNNAARIAWSKGQPIAGTAAERYLEARGIMPVGDTAETLRFNIYKSRMQLLAAARTWARPEEKGRFVAVQRIFIRADGSKDHGDDNTAKRVLGHLTADNGDAAFFILRGSDSVYVHEGVEDALATRRAFIDAGLDAPTVVATFGVGRFKAAALTFTGATFVPDSDNVGSAEDAARRACGLIARLNFPGCKDANEVLLKHGPDALVHALQASVEVRFEDSEDERRERQREENRAIGEGVALRTTTEVISLSNAVERFVFISDGSRVADLERPMNDWAYADFANTYGASVKVIEVDGDKKTVPVARLWKVHRDRKTAYTRTFAPGRDKFTVDPQGLIAVNTWRPYVRLERSDNFDRHVELFLNHVFYLFGEDADRFLDWVSHIEQQPGILPHTAWLHVSEKTGTGRNALAGILTRIWRGHVAASLDLMAVLKSGFNGQLSSKLLAIVDEIREGGRDHWEHSQRLKSLITEERRTINPKYGRQSVEFNCCRFLLLSNHRMALPIDENDRRFEAVMCTAGPRSEAYYAELYRAVENPLFINDVALWMAERDLSGFKPGRRALATAAKVEIARASESEGMSYARQLVEFWPADVVPSGFAARLINPDFLGSTSGAVRAIMSDAGIVPYGKAIKMDGSLMRPCILRNHGKWKAADGVSVAKEIRRSNCNYTSADPREELDRIIADLGPRVDDDAAF